MGVTDESKLHVQLRETRLYLFPLIFLLLLGCIDAVVRLHAKNLAPALFCNIGAVCRGHAVYHSNDFTNETADPTALDTALAIAIKETRKQQDAERHSDDDNADAEQRTFAGTIDSCQGRLPDVLSRYEITKRLGEGYQAQGNLLRSKTDKKEYVGIFFAHKAGAEEGINKTIEIGKALAGAPNMMQLKEVACNQGMRIPIFKKCSGESILMYRYYEHTCFLMSKTEMNILTRQVMAVIKYLPTAGKTGLWHADLYYNNLLYDESKRKLCVIDYGMVHSIPPWFNNPKKRAAAEQYQYKRIVLSKPEDRPTLHRDDYFGLAKTLLHILDVSITRGEEGQDTSNSDGPHELSFEGWIRLHGKKKYLAYVEEYKLQLPTNYFEEVGLDFDALPDDGIEDYKQLENKCNKGVIDQQLFDIIKGLTEFRYFDRQRVFEETLKLIETNKAFPVS